MDSVLDNEDLVTEILLRLPTKSLIGLKSVSKKWLSLISSDYFCHQHTLRHPNPQQSLILQFRSWAKPEIIIQSINGLLLLKPDDHDHRSNYFYVYNPTTNRSRKINVTSNATHPHVADVALAFDPSKSPYYDLVCIRSSSISSPISYKIEVYTSKSHTWKELSSEPFTHPTTISFIPRGVRFYRNNTVYWSSHGGYLCFDIAKNETRTLPYPASDDGAEGEDAHRHLLEANGHVFHVLVEGGRHCESVAVWELVGDDEWVLKHRHALTTTGWECPSVLAFLVDMCNLLIFRDGRIMVYSTLRRSYENFLDSIFQTKASDLVGFQFGETLALV